MILNKDRQAALAQRFLLEGKALAAVERATLETLAAGARLVRGGKNMVLYSPDKPAPGLLIPATGVVAISVQGIPASEKIVEVLGPGQMFGEEQIFSREPNAATARLLGDGLVITVPRAAVLAAVARSAALTRALLDNLARRSLGVMQRTEWHATRPGLERLAAFLMQQLPAHGDGPHELSLGIPKKVIASVLGMTKESLSRCLRQLRNENRLQSRGKTLKVVSAERLAYICSSGLRDCPGCSGCARGGRWLP